MGRRKPKNSEPEIDTSDLDDEHEDGLAENDDGLGEEQDDDELADPTAVAAGTPPVGGTENAPGAPATPATPAAGAAPDAGAGTPPAADARGARDPVEDAVVEFCGYVAPGAKRAVKARILSRSSADRNVATLELGNGNVVESVPRWNEQGEQPPFAVWVGDDD